MSSPERQPRAEAPEKTPAANAYFYLGEADSLAHKPPSAGRDAQIAALYKQIEEVFTPQETVVEEGISSEEAWRIMGDNYLGPVEIQEAFQVEMDDVPPIQFSAEELERAKELNQQLILFVDKTVDGKPLNILKMNELISGKTADGKKMLYASDGGVGIKSDVWYKDEPFLKDVSRAGWRLVSKEIVPNSQSKNYLQQTEQLATDIAKKEPVPAKYLKAIGELAGKKKEIEKLISSDWKKAGDMLQALEITHLTRETAPEAIYRLIINERKNKERSLPDKYTWTATRSSDGDFVYVGYFDADGVSVGRRPDDSNGALGACLSRS